MIGGFGDAEVFSFHATKFFNTFEGGAVVTNDDGLAERMRLMKNFGFAGYDNVIYIGTNGKMSEASAAMGLTGLESLDNFVAINHRNYQQYRDELADIPGLLLISYDDQDKHNYQYIVVEVDSNVTGLTRDDVVEILHAENVLVRRYFYPGCHAMEPYRTLYPQAKRLLPKTEAVAARVLILPTGTSVETSDIAAIGQILRCLFANSVEIQRRLSQRRQRLILLAQVPKSAAKPRVGRWAASVPDQQGRGQTGRVV